MILVILVLMLVEVVHRSVTLSMATAFVVDACFVVFVVVFVIFVVDFVVVALWGGG